MANDSKGRRSYVPHASFLVVSLKGSNCPQRSGTAVCTDIAKSKPALDVHIVLVYTICNTCVNSDFDLVCHKLDFLHYFCIVFCKLSANSCICRQPEYILISSSYTV